MASPPTPGLAVVHIAPWTALPFPDGAFDAVLAVDVFHHAGDMGAALGLGVAGNRSETTANGK